MLCHDLDMNNANLLIEDVSTRWNSTYEMIEAAWEKRRVLDKMASDYLNTNKINYSILEEEWDLLKIFSDELESFSEATNIFSQSKSITSPFVFRVHQILLGQLQSSIDNLDTTTRGISIGDEVARSLRGAYTAMMEKLVEYQPQIRVKPMFPIAALLDPRKKLDFISEGERLMTICTTIQLANRLSFSLPSTNRVPFEDPPSTSKRSKLMTALMVTEKPGKRYTYTSARDEVEDYLKEPCIGSSNDPLSWWCEIGSVKYPRLSVLASQFLSICASSAPSERLFSAGRGITAYRRGRLCADSISILMTLKFRRNQDDEKQELYIIEEEDFDVENVEN